jgi:hypothetical protein
MNELSRRTFLKLGGGVVAGAGVVMAGAMVGIAAPGSAEAAVDVSNQLPAVSIPGRDDALLARAGNVSSYISKVSEEV